MSVVGDNFPPTVGKWRRENVEEISLPTMKIFSSQQTSKCGLLDLYMLFHLILEYIFSLILAYFELILYLQNYDNIIVWKKKKIAKKAQQLSPFTNEGTLVFTRDAAQEYFTLFWAKVCFWCFTVKLNFNELAIIFSYLNGTIFTFKGIVVKKNIMTKYLTITSKQSK